MIQPIRPQDASGIYQRQVTQAQDAIEAAGPRRADGAHVPGRRTDQLSLSDEARVFARVMQAVTEAPDTRAARVAELRDRVDAGQYRVDADMLARLLIERGVQA